MRDEEIDDALRRLPAWEPPPDFSRRLAATALSAHARPLPTSGPLALVLDALRSAALDAQAFAGGLHWTLRQYWLLLAR